MGYKDRAWCPAICGNTACPRNVTPEVSAAAERWWGKPGAPFWFDAGLEVGCPDKMPVMEDA